MIIDFLNNLAITSALLFLAGKFFERKPLNFNSSIRTKIFAGIFSGLSGVLLMISTIKATDTVIVDLRHLPVIVAAIYGGPLSAIVSATIIAGTRSFIFGVSYASLIASMVAFIMGLFSAYLSRTNLTLTTKYIFMNGFCVGIVSMTIHYLVKDSEVSYEVFLYYWPISIIAGIFTYMVSEYIKKSNENSRYISHFKVMAENSSDLISTHKQDGTFTYLSPSCKKLLGYESEELIGKGPFSLYHPEDIVEVRRSYSFCIQEKKDNIVSYRIKRKDGNYIWFETTSKIMDQTKGKPEELLCISRDITDRKYIEDDLKEKNIQLELLSNMDGVTHIYNRRFFDVTLQTEWNRAVNNSAPLSLIMFDIDHFKSYNDTYGHQIGDECLKKIATSAQLVLIRSSDVVARYGGEEFAIILPNTNIEAASKVAEEIRSAIQALAIPSINSKVLPVVTISVGVSCLYPVPDANPLQLIANADQALYKAKSDGRNRVSVNNELIGVS